MMKLSVALLAVLLQSYLCLEFLEIMRHPPEDIYLPSMAECRIVGTPIPSVQWLRHVENFKVDTAHTSGIATVVTRLYEPPPHTAHTKRKYTCMGKTGDTSVAAESMVHFTGDEFKLQIMQYYYDIFDKVGSKVTLLCRVPVKCDHYWISPSRQVLSSNEKYFVTEEGDLIIHDLQFSDIGTYICIVKLNDERDTIDTFVYALAD